MDKTFSQCWVCLKRPLCKQHKFTFITPGDKFTTDCSDLKFNHKFNIQSRMFISPVGNFVASVRLAIYNMHLKMMRAARENRNG